MTSAEQKRLSPILRAVAAKNVDGLGAMAQAEIDRLSRKRIRQPLPGKSRKETAREKRDRRHAAMSAIRSKVEERSGGFCEVCGQSPSSFAPLELHHLLSGNGRRREQQAVSNCLMVCAMCHTIGHGRILYVGDSLLKWARKYGYSETEKVIRGRIDKALIADPTWPRDEDETKRLGPQKVTP